MIATMPVGLEPEGAAISPDGRWVYITSESSSSVSVIDTQSGQVVKHFLVGARPREAVSVINTIDLPRGEGSAQLKTKGVAVSPDGKRVYVATGRGNSVAVIVSEQLKLIILIPVGPHAGWTKVIHREWPLQ